MKGAVARLFATYGKQPIAVARNIGVIILISLVAEIFIFNFNYWQTAGYNTVDLSSKLTFSKNADGVYKITESNRVIELANINKEVKNVRLDFDESAPAQNVQVKIEFTDEGHETYFDSTEYSSGVPVRTIATNDDRTEFLKLNTAGITNNLRIEILNEDVSYPILLKSFSINNVYDFSFSGLRFFLLAGFLLLVYVFNPRSMVYRMGIVEHPRASKAAVTLVVVVEIYLVSSLLFMGSNLVGVATANYNEGSWLRNSVVTTFSVGGENAQQYSELAKSFAHGQVWLEKDPPSWLKEMDNPYDKGARDELQKATGEDYLWDVAYYEGHYYVYFGVVPVIFFYLPYFLVTGSSFPTAIGVWLACIAFMLGCTALLDRFARYHFQRVSLGLYLHLQIPLIFCSGILYLTKFPNFYSLPIMMALAFSVWGVYLWMRGRASKKRWAWFLAGSACMALVFGCRPQFIVLSLIAFPLFWRPYIKNGRIRTKQGAIEFACLILPYLIVFAGIMLYNHARFGSYFDFGSNYNLTTNDMTKRGWDLGRLAPALFAFFIQSPNTVGTFPFLQACVFDTTYMGQTIKEVTFGGLFATLPILWILALTPMGIKMRVRARSTHTITGVVCILVASGLVIALADAEMAGILQRYYADFAFMFLMVVVLVVFILNENIDHESRSFTLALRVMSSLVFVSVAYSLLLSLVAETGWYSQAYPWAYQSLIHTFQFWT